MGKEKKKGFGTLKTSMMMIFSYLIALFIIVWIGGTLSCDLASSNADYEVVELKVSR